MNVCETFVWKETKKSFSKYVKLYGVLPYLAKGSILQTLDTKYEIRN